MTDQDAAPTPVPGGYKIRETDEYVIEVIEMLFNWRLLVMLPNQNSSYTHGYCYFGRTKESFIRAVMAGTVWNDPLNIDPEDFDKKAF